MTAVYSRLLRFLTGGADPELLRRVFQIGWPAMLESIFVGLAGLFDTAMVGTLGTTAVSAVGLTNQPKFVCFAVILSLNVGVTALVARRVGEGDMEGASETFRQCLFLSFAFSAAICTAAFLFAEPFLLLAGAKEDTIADAVVYFRHLMPGQFFQHLYVTCNAAMRCAGNSKVSLRTNTVSSVSNICMNYLLIGGNFGFPALGVRGAAIATSLSYIFAFFIAVSSLFSPECRLNVRTLRGWLPTRNLLTRLQSVAVGALVENICLRIGFFIYSRTVAGLGTVPFAAHQICMNIANVSLFVFDGPGTAAAALVGQDLGAKKPERARQIAESCVRIAILIGLVLMAGLAIFRGPLLLIFSRDPAVLAPSKNILLMIAASAVGDALCMSYAGALRGAGDTRFVAMASLLSVTLIRPALSWYLCYPAGLGLYGPWIGFLLDLWLRGLLNAWRFRQGNWQKIRL